MNKTKPNIFSIPPHLNFIDVLVTAINNEQLFKTNKTQPTPFKYADYTIFIPTRRAGSALADAFAKQNGNIAQIMPKIIPLAGADEISDPVQEYETENQEEPDIIGKKYTTEIMPPIDKIGQNFILQKLLFKWANNNTDSQFNEPAEAIKESINHRIELADAMRRLYDQFAIEEKNINALETIKNFPTDDFAEHWQTMIPVLHIIIRDFPQEIQKINREHPIIRRNQLMHRATQYIKNHNKPVIAVGSTGSTPATADFLKTVAYLKNGAVILPGLDTHMDQESHKNIDPQHPQSNIKHLLEIMDANHSDVQILPKHEKPNNPRTQLLSEVMRPVETTHLWNQTRKEKKQNQNQSENTPETDGLHIITAPNRKKEATAIALIIRKYLQEPNKTIALITPNRQLAQYVIADLKRWDIHAADSAGIPISQTQNGLFAALTCEVIKQDFHPIPLIAWLKHPLCAFHADPSNPNDPKYKQFQKLRHDLEHTCLRGYRHPGGITGLHTAFTTRRRQVQKHKNRHTKLKHMTDHQWDNLAQFINELERIFEPLATIREKGKSAPLEKIIHAHIQVLENATTTPKGETLIWSQKNGAENAQFFANLLENAQRATTINSDEYPTLFEKLSTQHIIKTYQKSHPRISILGQLEARLLTHDITILGAVNEGIWPKNPESNPWLNRPMIKKLKLSPPEKFISFAAHDFVQAAAKPHVYITWAEKHEQNPTAPSRWIQRLHAITNRTLDNQNKDWIQWAIGLDDRNQDPTPATMPEPKPPLKYRPRKLSVTEIEKWLKNPYEIYAKYILKLKPLEKYDIEPAAAERGTIIHEAMEIFAKKYAETIPQDPEHIEQALIEAGETAFSDWTEYPDVAAFWRPRFERIAQWLAVNNNLMLGNVRQSFHEIGGRFTFIPYKGGEEITLTGRADRIDILNGNAIRIIDYKTGNIPYLSEKNKKFSPQLFLEAVMVQNSAFKDIPSIKGKSVAELIYIGLKGGNPPGEHRRNDPKINIQDTITETFKKLQKYIQAFDNETHPYTPIYPQDYSDYEQLSRFYEWGEEKDEETQS